MENKNYIDNDVKKHIIIEVQMTVKIMYNYVLQHTYTSIGGIFGMVLGIVSLFWGAQSIATKGVTQSGAAILLLGFMFVVVNPIMLWSKSRKQVKRTPSFQKPLSYELNEEGIVVRQDGQETKVAWESIVKVTATNMSVIIYFSRMRAFILPKQCFGENYENAIKLIFQKVPIKKVKIRTMSQG